MVSVSTRMPRLMLQITRGCVVARHKKGKDPRGTRGTRCMVRLVKPRAKTVNARAGRMAGENRKRRWDWGLGQAGQREMEEKENMIRENFRYLHHGSSVLMGEIKRKAIW